MVSSALCIVCRSIGERSRACFPPALALSSWEIAQVAGSSCEVITALVLTMASVAFCPCECEDEAAIAGQIVDPLTDRTDLHLLALEWLGAVGLPTHGIKPEHPADQVDAVGDHLNVR